MSIEKSSLFCPVCGIEGQHANSYCKRCGEWLPNFKRRSRGTFGGETPQQNVFINIFMGTLSAAVALFSAIALYATYLGTNEAKWSVYVAAAFCLCIAGWQASSLIASVKLARRLRKGRETVAPTQMKPEKEPAALHPADMSSFVNVSSVAEGTTDLLESKRSVQVDRNTKTQRP